MRYPPSSCLHNRFLLLSIFAASILGGPQGCGGGGSDPSAVVAPSNLVYPQPNITATVGTAIPDDVPTVTGTVDSYAVNPTLPVGLNLNGSTGAISGTPTSVAAQATYAVTASNSSGSTSTKIQIVVNAPVEAPSKLVYPQRNITATVGTAIPTDIPTVIGTVDFYTASPTLPAGLNLNTSNGAISGIPTAVAASASYTVTASNSGGSATFIIKILVNKSLPVLLELGHAWPMEFLQLEKSRLLSRDFNFHWALWDYDSGSMLANGDQSPMEFSNPLIRPTLALAGGTVVIGLPNGLEVRSSLDGHLLSTIVSPNLNYSFGASPNSWWDLATDGSYICAGSQSGLSVWLPSGLLVVTRPGDYSQAKSFAAPSELRIALGPAGQNVVETISMADGTPSIGPMFSGLFNSWFLDGERFLTNVSNTVWTYSKAGIQQSLVTMPSVENLTGQGDWVWTYGSNVLNIYAIGSTSAAASYPLVVEFVKGSGTTIGAIPNGGAAISVIDLSGSSPTKVDHDLPIAFGAVGTAYAARSASQWVVGNEHGVVLDGASLSSTARYFGLGVVWSIAGADNLVAIAVASGKILLMNPNDFTLEGTINFSASKLQVSSDGSVLAAMANANDPVESDRTLNVFSLPTGSLTNSWPYTYGQDPFLIDFSLSLSGTTIGQVLQTSSTQSLTRQVAARTGGPTIWSDSLSLEILFGRRIPDPSLAIRLSPDGTLIAVSNRPPDPKSGTNIIKNGTLITAVPGVAVGWIDDNRLLVNNYVAMGSDIEYSGCTIYNSMGVKLTQPNLPELTEFQAVTSDLIYSAYNNTIFSLSSGSAAWTTTTPAYIVGAVSGPHVVFLSVSRLLVDSY